MSTPVEDVLDDDRRNNAHMLMLIAFGLYIVHLYSNVIDEVLQNYVLKDQYNLKSLTIVALILTGVFALLLREKNIV